MSDDEICPCGCGATRVYPVGLTKKETETALRVLRGRYVRTLSTAKANTILDVIEKLKRAMA